MFNTVVSSFTLCQYVAKDSEEECQEEQYSVSRLFILLLALYNFYLL